MSTGCSKSKFNLSVSKSISEPASANNSFEELFHSITDSISLLSLSIHLSSFLLVKTSPFFVFTAQYLGTITFPISVFTSYKSTSV
jgi:hypothetical protein